MVPPLLKDWSQFDRLRFDPPSLVAALLPAARRVRGPRAGNGGSATSSSSTPELRVRAGRRDANVPERRRVPGACPPGDRFGFRSELCGSNKKFFAAVPLAARRNVQQLRPVVPGRIVSESLDPFHMTSVAYFEQWGREPVERISPPSTAG